MVETTVKDRLRVIDAGAVGALRSQSLWHGIASAMVADSLPVLSLCQPREPYVSIGFHRSIDEIDREACARFGLPVLRRQIGGGPVYIDGRQLFFQISLPSHRAPARVDRLYTELLAPAVQAFRALGIEARLRGSNDIAIADRRLSGTGAGRIGDGVTVVGNVIFRFDHARMVEVLALPTETMRRECGRLMRRHVSSLEAQGVGGVTFDDAKAALVAAYSRGLGLAVMEDRPTSVEEQEIAHWQTRLESEAWRAGAATGGRRPARVGRQVKICAGVWVFAARTGELDIQISVIDGRLEKVMLAGASLNGKAASMRQVLLELPAEAGGVSERLAGFGVAGRRVADLLIPGLALP